MRQTLLCFIALFLIHMHVTAQPVPKPDSEDSTKLAEAIQYLQTQENIPKAPQSIQSPNVASFGSYGEIPVSLFMGKPEITVNLHEVFDGSVRLPISLAYDAAGVRPEQHPGWVGMNFTLSTHYAVTRTVRDGPDDNKATASTLGEHGFGYNTALINNVDWSQNAGIIGIANTTLNQIHIDTEPDEFTFSAPGLSGKFYLGSDAKWKVQCDRPVKVQLINSGTPSYPPFTPPTFTGNQWDSYNNQHYAEHFEGFIITDDLGTQYVFAVLSSGVLAGKAQYYWPDYKPLPETQGVLIEEDIFSTQSVLPVSENSMGAHIGYSQVIERSSTEGWNVYQFSNFDNGYRDEGPSGFLQPSATPYQPYNNKSYTRGKLISAASYYQNGNPASKTTQVFAPVGPLGDYSARSVKTLVTLLCQTNHKVYEGTASVNDVRKFLPVEIVQNTYDQDNPASFTSSVTTKMYWPNGQLDIEGRNDSKGRAIKHWYRYPPNEGDAISIALTTKHMIGPVIEIFKYSGLDVLPTPIKETRIYYDLFSGAYQPQKVESQLGNWPLFTTDIEFLTYDPRGNLLTYKELNGPTRKLEYFGLADIGKADLLKKRTIADGVSIAQSTTYDYKPAIGMETIQDPNGKAIFYDYDSFNRLKSVVSNNAAGPKRATYCYNLAGQVVDCAALAPAGTVAAPPLVLIAEAALPVTLVDFTAERQEKTALLSWITTYESNSDHFEIQRSGDGKQWETIGTVMSHRESAERQSYAFTDPTPLPTENLYRLKMVDQDSTYAYSRIQSVTFGDVRDALLYPNPITIDDKLFIRVSDPSTIASITIFDSGGVQTMSCPWQPEIDVSRLPTGLYIVRIAYRDGSVGVHRIARQ
ncbi:T9SS type A sorting domain-containing protein [Dyadobacter sp. CY261]|uniref:T9SS type A sorting domain-containing protein n=1 Tax=Dyadobacter sp. CY261 TaxID=2907203 RepID=UPI001F20DEF3|nr:T9SS type A sorting domain-containing protein [Dyadobacter sp. CY261]MCF0073695.1 T9SS type A sorting domain-containing protein [Dyadobacter sp. CY261]